MNTKKRLEEILEIRQIDYKRISGFDIRLDEFQSFDRIRKKLNLTWAEFWRISGLLAVEKFRP